MRNPVADLNVDCLSCGYRDECADGCACPVCAAPMYGNDPGLILASWRALAVIYDALSSSLQVGVSESPYEPKSSLEVILDADTVVEIWYKGETFYVDLMDIDRTWAATTVESHAFNTAEDVITRIGRWASV